MSNTNILLAGRSPDLITPAEAMQQAANANNALAQGAMRSMQAQQLGQQMRDEGQFNALMDQAGGDYNKIMQDPSVNWRVKQQVGAQLAEQDAARAKNHEAAVDAHIKELDVLGRYMSPVKDQATYDYAKSQLANVPGMAEKVAQMPKEYNADIVNSNLQMAMSHKDQLLQQREQRQAEYQNKSLDLQERRLQAAENRANDGQTRAPAGYQFQPDGSLAPIKGGPADKQGGQAKTPLSSKAQSELFEADDMINAGNNVITAIDAAMQYNDKAYSGIGASQRAFARSQFGDDESANATIQMDNIIKDQALSSMKAIFGGNPTEGERAVLLELQASTEKTPAQRAEILGRAKQAALRRIEINKQKAQALRSGSYFNEAPEAAPSQPSSDNIDDLLEMYK